VDSQLADILTFRHILFQLNLSLNINKLIRMLSIPRQMRHVVRDGAWEWSHLIYFDVFLNATKSLQRLSWQLETKEIVISVLSNITLFSFWKQWKRQIIFE
jgi:hypothetical protein